ncbi:MAG: hypothetical protein ACYSYU_07700, partial [Planctomycetota bacterium]
DVWDFGEQGTAVGPGYYCSYSYHQPFNYPHDRPLTSESSALSPLCADRNPYLDKNATAYIDGQMSDESQPYWGTPIGEEYMTYLDIDRTGNAAAHQREGQNVLYNDGHVRFERYPNVGIANDNIWKYWPKAPPLTPQDKQLGSVGPSALGNPSNVGEDATWATPTGQMNPTTFATTEDAYLVNEMNY